MDIATLRKSRSSNFAKITSEFEKIVNPQSGNSYEDDRYWKLERDKAGNGSAVIRFLPSTDANELPWVRIFSHGFKGPTGKWYIENSLTTLGEDDPVGELNAKLWNSGNDSDKKIAQARKRRLNYVSNILVISDPKHPENEGRVFLFKYGKKIFDMLMDKARPTFEDEKPVNVFDFWEGANFKLRMRKKDGYANYDESAFMEPAPIGSDDEIVKYASAQHKLSEFTDRKNFKSYDELKKKLSEVLSGDAFAGKSAAELAADAPASIAAPEPARSAPAFTPKASVAPAMDDDEDVMSYFEKIAKEE
jgi:hypothetical protein